MCQPFSRIKNKDRMSSRDAILLKAQMLPPNCRKIVQLSIQKVPSIDQGFRPSAQCVANSYRSDSNSKGRLNLRYRTIGRPCCHDCVGCTPECRSLFAVIIFKNKSRTRRQKYNRKQSANNPRQINPPYVHRILTSNTQVGIILSNYKREGRIQRKRNLMVVSIPGLKLSARN